MDKYPEFPVIFGTPIENLYRGESGAPHFIEVIFEFIANHIEQEGVFRINGNRQNVIEMANLLRFPQCSVPPFADVFDVISLLKKFLLELPEPLLSPDIMNRYFHPNEIETFKDVLAKIPEVNRKTFLLIIELLCLTLQNNKSNKMTMANLTICFQTPLFKNHEGLDVGVPFPQIIQYCFGIINETWDDFKLD